MRFQVSGMEPQVPPGKRYERGEAAGPALRPPARRLLRAGGHGPTTSSSPSFLPSPSTSPHPHPHLSRTSSSIQTPARWPGAAAGERGPGPGPAPEGPGGRQAAPHPRPADRHLPGRQPRQGGHGAGAAQGDAEAEVGGRDMATLARSVARSIDTYSVDHASRRETPLITAARCNLLVLFKNRLLDKIFQKQCWPGQDSWTRCATWPAMGRTSR